MPKNQKSKELEALNVYVQRAPKWELPFLRQQCVQMIKMIDARSNGNPMPKMKVSLWERLVRRFKRKKR